MQAIDHTAIEIERFVSEFDLEGVFALTKIELDDFLAQKVPTYIGKGTLLVDPINATPYLHKCRKLIEKKLRAKSNRYTSIQWLWYLRRLPRVIFDQGKYNTTFTYDSALTEILSNHSNKKKRIPLSQKTISYPIDKSTVLYILKFCFSAVYLSHIHVLLRLAGKGCNFEFDGTSGLPVSRLSHQKQAAINLYDRRVEKYTSPLLRAGTILSSIDAETTNSFLFVYPVAEPDWTPSILGPLTNNPIPVDVYARFLPRFISLDNFAELNSDPRLINVNWYDPKVVNLLILLSLSVPVINKIVGIVSIMQYGYYTVPYNKFLKISEVYFQEICDWIKELFPNIRTPSSVKALMNSIQNHQSCLWPLIHNSPVRISENVLYIDLWAAGGQLEYYVEFPALNGAKANARAEHFERKVQELINDSPWRPPEEILKLQRRTLRFRTRNITDLDAIGVYNDRLLLVSCKSIIYSSEYDVGDFRQVRNISSTIETAVIEWNNIRCFFQQNLVGDNYNFAQYAEIISVVCVPHVVYSDMGVTTEFVSRGLRACVSANELNNWLHHAIQDL